MFYICPVCGNVIYVMNGDANRVRCCGKEMIPLVANDKDASLEKHVPFCTKDGDNLKVTIGEVEHPMSEEHYIMWVAMVKDSNINIIHFNPGDKPTCNFKYEKNSTIYAYCNIHGLWKKDVE